MRNVILTFGVVVSLFLVQGCSDATVASHNLSKAAEQFELNRRIVFYNGITDQYILSVEGKCSLQVLSAQLAVTCKVDREAYKKHYLGLSDNVTYFSEQLESAQVGVYHYRVIFKPQTVVPDVDLKVDP